MADLLTLLSGGLSRVFNLVSGAGGEADIGGADIVQIRPRIPQSAIEAIGQWGAVQTLCGIRPLWALAQTPKLGVVDPDLADKVRRRSEELGIIPALARAATYAESTGLGALLLAERGATRLADPLPSTARIGAVHPLSRWQIKPVPNQWISNVDDPWCGWPEFWQVYPYTGRYDAGHIVHISRLAIVRSEPFPWSRSSQSSSSGDGLDAFCYALPERIFPELMREEVSQRELSRLLQRHGFTVLKLGDDRWEVMLTSDEGSANYSAAAAWLAKARSAFGLGVLPQGSSLEIVSPPLAGAADLDKAIANAKIRALGWPAAIVAPEHVGGLGDGANLLRIQWGPLVAAYQTAILARPLEQLAAVLCGDSGRPGADFSLSFPDPIPLSSTEIATIQQSIALADQTNITAGVYTTLEARSRYTGSDLVLSLTALPAEPPPSELDSLLAAALPVGYITSAERLAPKDAAGNVLPANAEALLSVMGIDPEDAAKIATPPTEEGQPLADEDLPSLWIGLKPAAPGGWEQRLAPLRDAVKALIPGFAPDTDPHVTLLYAGPSTEDAAFTAANLTAEWAGVGAISLTPVRLTAFPTGDRGRAIVVELSPVGILPDLHADLVSEIPVSETVRQFPDFRPHVTLGYAPEPDLAAIEAVLMLPLPAPWSAVQAVAEYGEGDPARTRLADASERDSIQIPTGVSETAQRVLDLWEEHGDQVKGMTRIGWTRAAQLARGGNVSRRTFLRIRSYLARSEKVYRQQLARVKTGEIPLHRSAAVVAWLGWGGDAAKSWTASDPE